MLAARALIYAIGISLLLAIISTLLIQSTIIYNTSNYQLRHRSRLRQNIQAAHAIIKAQGNQYFNSKKLSLYSNEIDSIEISKKAWGLYDLAVAKAFLPNKDSLKEAILLGTSLPLLCQSALYISNLGKRIQIGGKSNITGKAYLPTQGVRAIVLSNLRFKGDKIINGEQKVSTSELPSWDSDKLLYLYQLFSLEDDKENMILRMQDSCSFSFLNPTQILKGTSLYIDQVNWKGNLIIIADKSIRVSATAQLQDVLLIAPEIYFDQGGQHQLQAFASHKLEVGKNCIFSYPSALGILHKARQDKAKSYLKLGESSTLEGILFAINAKEKKEQIRLITQKNTLIKGQIYSQAPLIHKGTVHGNTSCSYIYEESSQRPKINYVVDAIFDYHKLHNAYLGPCVWSSQNSVSYDILQKLY